MAKDLAIVLNNGSINSAVTSTLAAQRYRLVLLHVENSDQTNPRVKAAYEQQVGHFKPHRQHTIPLTFPGIARPRPTDTSAAPQQPQDLAPRLLELTSLISTAARYAAQYQAAAIYLGLRVGPAGDELAAATEYFQIWNELLQLPCGRSDLEILTPLLELEPWQVVDVGFNVAAPLDRTWSCLEESVEPCGTCPGCRAREQAFQQAAKPDPMHVAAKP